MTLDASGNLGIGTTSPSHRLDVQSGSSPTINIKNTALGSGNISQLLFQGTNNFSGTSTSFIQSIALSSGNSNTALVFGTNAAGGGAAAEVMRLDQSGNLGLGVTPQIWSSTFKPAFQFGTTGSLLNGSGYTFLSTNYYQDATGTDKYITTNFATNYYQYNGIHVWRTAASGTAGNNLSFSESMRIDTSGNLLVGTTSLIGNGKVNVNFAGGSASSRGITAFSNSTAGTAMFSCNNSNGIVGEIVSTGSATAYNTSSDYRLKNTIAPMTGALAKVALLKPVTYKWNADNSDGEGFIAHELAEVCPQAVTGEKDAVNEDGSIKPQGIDTSFLVATLTAAIQEQQALIQSLKARLDAANL